MRRRPIASGIAVAAVAALLAGPGFGQDQELRDEIEALKQGQAEMRKQLAEIMRMLQTRQQPTPRRAGADVEGRVFTVGGNPTKGADTAKLTLVEFTDYQ